jgi:transposase-like protein
MTLPAPPACLNRPYCARPNQTGGTLIAEDVREPNEHRRRLLDPDDYRPCACPTCRGSRLHAHSYRERRIKIGGGISTEEQVRRYRCVACRAVWLVLPGFLARHLHRTWSRVQTALGGQGLAPVGRSAARETVPATTLRRWVGRLASSAQALIAPLAGLCPELCAATQPLLADFSRGALVQALLSQGLLVGGYALSQIAGWIHRQMPGLRLL